MHLLGNNIRSRKQNAGNLCLVLFLVFLFTTVFMPVVTQDAYAADLPPADEPLLEAIDGYSWWYSDTQIGFDAVLQPTTDVYFDSIYVDFSEIVGVPMVEQYVYKQIYESVYEGVYSAVYGYVIDFVYDIPDGWELIPTQNPILVRDAENNLVWEAWVDMEVKPPEATFKLETTQSNIPVGDTVWMDINLEVVDQQKILGAQFELSYDPNLLEVVDGDAIEPGTQLKPGSGLTGNYLTITDIDLENGKILFAMAADAPLNSPLDLASIGFKALKSGSATLTFDRLEAINESDENLVCTAEDLKVNTIDVARVRGKVTLLERNSHVGVEVFAGGTAYKTLTDATGHYTLELPPGTYDIGAAYPKFLQKIVRNRTLASGDNLAGLNFELIPGDANADNKVSLMDLVVMAGEYGVPNATESDFDGDNDVDITDLTILAKYYLSLGDN